MYEKCQKVEKSPILPDSYRVSPELAIFFQAIFLMSGFFQQKNKKTVKGSLNTLKNNSSLLGLSG